MLSCQPIRSDVSEVEDHVVIDEILRQPLEVFLFAESSNSGGTGNAFTEVHVDRRLRSGIDTFQLTRGRDVETLVMRANVNITIVRIVTNRRN